MGKQAEDQRYIKGISFTNEYKEELKKLQAESNGSRLVCSLLRKYYNNEQYTLEELREDIKDIKDILKGLDIKL